MAAITGIGPAKSRERESRMKRPESGVVYRFAVVRNS